MTPPPIRYPLPTLALIAACGLLAWKGGEWSRPLRSAIASRFERALAGPPVPASDSPQRLAGPVNRRVLLLRDGTTATDRPGGRAVETIRLRQFADVYDAWPLTGPATHYRIGNRRPIGWIRAGEALEWSSRLAIRSEGRGLALSDSPGGDPHGPVAPGPDVLPVLGWEGGSVRVALWDSARPWVEVARTGWLPQEEASRASWGVWISRDELLALLGLLGRAKTAEAGEEVRWRAITGRIPADRPWSPDDLAAVRDRFSAPFPSPRAPSVARALEALARFNEGWSPGASWSGLSFQILPLDLLP